APAEQLDEIVWKDLCEVLTHPENITDALRRAHGGQWLPQELRARQENLRQGRAALGRQLERLTEAYLGEVIPLVEYQRRRKDLEQRDEALAAQEGQLQTQSRQRMELAGVAGSIEDFCERVSRGVADATFEQKRKLVELLIDRVIVTDERVEIRYVIPTDPSSEQVRFCHLRSDYLNHPPQRGKIVEPFSACGCLTTSRWTYRSPWSLRPAPRRCSPAPRRTPPPPRLRPLAPGVPTAPPRARGRARWPV
ncbi:MAG: hypothetical protein M3N18_12760, partial [Actinomycetota bacterium]|nr:hypothetical protein [Actinomycetota bacterium]